MQFGQSENANVMPDPVVSPSDEPAALVDPIGDVPQKEGEKGTAATKTDASKPAKKVRLPFLIICTAD